MKANEIRSLFLKYFEKNGHTIVESSPLVPQNDPTLLFTNAGMVQFKDLFLGKEKRSYTRATTSQKCVRAGGKHNDLENVGFTARHHTFFEMLGNFSFGDYFKKEAIRLAWGFVTQELKMSREHLYVTVFENDDEAAQIWHQQEGVPLDRIFRFGEKDNFWSMGDTGPCGPCSEIFYDRGPSHSCGKPSCGMGCDCDRYMEFWNLVFMQFERSADGKLTPLPRPSVDTGAGLERLASILQGVDTNYDTDVFQEIILKTARLLSPSEAVGKKLTAVPFRVIADHSRATTFLIGDGVLPSNEGRGYVLRRIIRRAIRHGKDLGFTGPFLHQVVGFVIDQMKGAYPDLQGKRALIEKAVLAEEEQFFRTLERGLVLLSEETARISQGKKVLPGDIAFKLYDTYGFPLDLTRVICQEQGLSIDEIEFEKCMERQRSESRKHWKGAGGAVLDTAYLALAQELRSRHQLPVFVGYDSLYCESECLALLGDKGDTIEVVFAQTPFYAESGGQVGDRGRVISADFEGQVVDVQKPVPDLIVAHVRPVRGELRVGAKYSLETDRELRNLAARNHTATHILHWALRKVLGPHVKQAGSLVSADLLRLDFSHFQPVTEAELLELENLINEKIWLSEPVAKREMAKDEAIAAGAIAFFGEKYGDRVRVVSVGEFSTELCGGTHVDNAAEIHLFKIANENGIAAGVRRIVAYTSRGAFEYLRKKDAEMKLIRDRLKASSTEEIMGKLDKMAAVEKDLRQQIGVAQSKSANLEVDELLGQSRNIGGVRVVTNVCTPDPEGIKRLRDLAERLKQKAADAVFVLGMKGPEEGRVSLLIAVGPQVGRGVGAHELLKVLLPLIEGRGGGKVDLAQAGGTRPEGLLEALSQAQSWLEKKLVG